MKTIKILLLTILVYANVFAQDTEAKRGQHHTFVLTNGEKIKAKNEQVSKTDNGFTLNIAGATKTINKTDLDHITTTNFDDNGNVKTKSYRIFCMVDNAPTELHVLLKNDDNYLAYKKSISDDESTGINYAYYILDTNKKVIATIKQSEDAEEDLPKYFGDKKKFIIFLKKKNYNLKTCDESTLKIASFLYANEIYKEEELNKNNTNNCEMELINSETNGLATKDKSNTSNDLLSSNEVVNYSIIHDDPYTIPQTAIYITPASLTMMMTNLIVGGFGGGLKTSLIKDKLFLNGEYMIGLYYDDNVTESKSSFNTYSDLSGNSVTVPQSIKPTNTIDVSVNWAFKDESKKMKVNIPLQSTNLTSNVILTKYITPEATCRRILKLNLGYFHYSSTYKVFKYQSGAIYGPIVVNNAFVGISKTNIFKYLIDTKYGKRGGEASRSIYLDCFVAPTLSIAESSLPIGFRVGFEGHSIYPSKIIKWSKADEETTHLFNIGYKFELGMLPGISGKGFYGQMGFYFPMINF
ncbi:MAG: hypothetical protein RJA07_1169 [Bacteroidota bacterium]|jgi:hypothetical protein